MLLYCTALGAKILFRARDRARQSAIKNVTSTSRLRRSIGFRLINANANMVSIVSANSFFISLCLPGPQNGYRRQSVSLPWGRLIEGSDSVGRLAVKVAGYNDTLAGFAVASAHIAALRHAGIPYSFRPCRDPAFPFGIVVVRKQIRHAKEVIGKMGLGVDTAG